jgi:hypothetical protein
MNRAWFRHLGWVCRPVSRHGWVVFALTVGFCINVFLALVCHSHSVSDTVYCFFPSVLPAALVLEWIPPRTAAQL